MSRHKLWTVLVMLLAQYVKQTNGGGTLTLTLIHFENPQSKLADGQCCDGFKEGSDRCNPCDYYFTFCLSQPAIKNCTIARIATQVLTTNEYHLFGHHFKSRGSSDVINNPIMIPVQTWSGELLLSIDVCDDDGDVTPPKNDLVTSMHQNISLVATRFGAAPETQFVLSFGKQRMPGIFPKLTMQLSVQCSKNYLIPNCSDYCIDSNDASGHFTCNYVKGTRDCYSGWYGLRCDKHCIPRNDQFGHFDCELNSGNKICLPGWLDASTNCTKENTSKLMSTRGKASSSTSIILSSNHHAVESLTTISDDGLCNTQTRPSCNILNATVARESRNFKNPEPSTIVCSRCDMQTTYRVRLFATSHNDILTTKAIMQSVLMPTHSYSGTRAVSKTISTTNAIFATSVSDRTIVPFAESSKATNSSSKSAQFHEVTEVLKNSPLYVNSLSNHITTYEPVESRRLNATPSRAKIQPTQWKRTTDLSYKTSLLLGPTTLNGKVTSSMHYITVQSVVKARSSDYEFRIARTSVAVNSYSMETEHKTVNETQSILSMLLPVSSLSSLHPVQEETRKQALRETRGFNKIWKDYQIHFLVSVGLLAFMFLFSGFVVRNKRKNRIQSLIQSESKAGQIENTRATCLEQDHADGENPYILVQKANDKDICITKYRSSASVKSNQLRTPSDRDGHSRCSSFLAPDASTNMGMRNHTSSENGSRTECRTRMECWTPVKYWTPTEIRAEETDFLMPNECQTERTPNDSALGWEHCTVKKDCSLNRFDNEKDGDVTTRGFACRFLPSFANNSSEIIKPIENCWFEKDCHSSCSNEDGLLCPVERLSRKELRTPGEFRTDVPHEYFENWSVGKQSCTPAGFEMQGRYQNFTGYRTPLGFPTIELTETNLCDGMNIGMKRLSSVKSRESLSDIDYIRLDSQNTFQCNLNYLSPPQQSCMMLPARAQVNPSLTSSGFLGVQRQNSCHLLVPNFPATPHADHP